MTEALVESACMKFLSPLPQPPDLGHRGVFGRSHSSFPGQGRDLGLTGCLNLQAGALASLSGLRGSEIS